MSYYSRLNKSFEGVPRLPLNNCTKYVLFSDCHRGVGTTNDNFLKNQNLYISEQDTHTLNLAMEMNYGKIAVCSKSLKPMAISSLFCPCFTVRGVCSCSMEIMIW